MEVERKTFREVFKENSDDSLTLLLDLKIKGTVFKKGAVFNSSDGLEGIDFHQFRYFDVAVEKEGDEFIIKGFYTKSKLKE